MGKQDIYDNLAENIGIENFKRIDKKKQNRKDFFQKILTVIICMVSITGMVCAKDISIKIYDNVYGGGNGYGKAMSEGYIEKVEMDDNISNSIIENEETGEIIEDLETKIKVEEFIMDDFSLSATFDITLSDKIKDAVKIEDIWNVSFPDLVVYDENYNVLRSDTPSAYNEFCKEKNIEPNEEEKWFGSGENGPLIESKDGNHLKVMFNIYIGGAYYPKSKKINFELTEIAISNKVETMQGNEQLSLKGDWKFSVDVPEKMYNRSSIPYIQKSTSNKDFNVTKATVYDTGMDISMKFQADKYPKRPSTPEIDFWNSLPKDDELKSIDILNYIQKDFRKTPEYKEYMEKSSKIWEFEKYLVNENGEKFEITVGNRENGGGYIDENGIYDFNAMFDLTKYDMTDKITLHVNYHGREADIILEKAEVK